MDSLQRKFMIKLPPLIRNKRNTIIKRIHKKLPVKQLHLMSHRIHLDTKKIIFKKIHDKISAYPIVYGKTTSVVLFGVAK